MKNGGKNKSIVFIILFSVFSEYISIEHITIFLRKYISKGVVDMKFSPDVGNK